MLESESNALPSEWVNTPLFTDLDERLATGGPDEGFPATFPNIVNKAVPAKKGDLVKIHWLNWPSGHIGPILNMMASCGGSCKGKKGASLDWFKISQENYNPQTKKWPLEVPKGTLGIDTKFTLPTNLPRGEYLLSQTLIAMHSVDGPQYYVSAFEIDLDSDGRSLPDLTMKIPAMYTEHRNDVTQFPKMVDNPVCYDWGLFRVPGVPVYDKSDSIAGDSGGNGAEEFDDTPLIVPSTCSWRTETVVGRILGASVGTYIESANKVESDAPVGSSAAVIILPSLAAPAAPPSGSQASGTLATSEASGNDCTSIVVSSQTYQFLM
ncbi:hypothetical protein QFC22_005514 [Naganishia vaughanmartiniae]|uniref:Uncharacterized protein n=1 Tax=Naganishia vaughanmartiniae TaxID=1424756 RepID=A0ACC2WS88_9TREE|nr:hypothetical protein QFC22_005514 [Naganishia vaughanmartiniae]